MHAGKRVRRAMAIISGYALRLQCAYRCRLARRHLALKLATRAALRIQASVRRRRVQLQLATTSPGVLCELKDLRAQVIANLHDACTHARTHARTHAYGRYGRYGLSQFSPPTTARPWLPMVVGWGRQIAAPQPARQAFARANQLLDSDTARRAPERVTAAYDECAGHFHLGIGSILTAICPCPACSGHEI
eukprot:COSAG01_NODE_6146_length_3825_cov_5.700751_4_plen_191_part_00